MNALTVGTKAEEVTPADHMRARASGLASCMDDLSVCTSKKREVLEYPTQSGWVAFAIAGTTHRVEAETNA